MYAGLQRCDEARGRDSLTFLADNVPGLGSLRLRREGLLRSGYAIDRMPEERRMGEVRFLRGRLIPRPRAPQYQFATEMLPVTFEIFLAWIVVQNGFDYG